MAEQRYTDALDYFQRAEAAHHAPTLMLRIARAHAKLGQFVNAREAYLSVKRENLDANAPAAFLQARTDAEAELPQVEAHIATVTLEVAGPTRDAARLKLDGTPLPSAAVGLPYPVDPRSHTIDAEADGFEPTQLEFSVESGGSATVNVVLRRLPQQTPTTALANDEVQRRTSSAAAPQSVPQDNTMASTDWARIGSYVGFGVGAVGLGLGAYFQLQSQAYDDDADAEYKRCLSIGDGETCTNAGIANQVFDLEKDAKRSHTNALALFALGGVGVTAGVVLFLLSGDDDAATAWKPYFNGEQLGVWSTF